MIAEKVLLLAKNERDACKTRRMMAAHDVIEARTREKEKTRDAKKRKDEETQDEGPATKEKAKPSK